MRGLREYNEGLHTCWDADSQTTGTSSSWTTCFPYPILTATNVANKSITTPEAKSEVPASPGANSPQNVEVSSTKAIRFILDSDNHNFPMILTQYKMMKRRPSTELLLECETERSQPEAERF